LSIQTLIRIETADNEVFDFLQVGEGYRIDSRDVAPGIGIEHKHFIETLRTYQAQLEHFGVVPFETAKPPKGSAGGRPETYVMLNRNQVLFAITLSRNTEQVVMWKMALIDALDQLEKQLVRPATRYLAAPSKFQMSEATRETLAVLQESPDPLCPKEIAARLQKPNGTIRKRLFVMKLRGEVQHTGEGYISLLDKN
jgi:phage regulator Rha-like protein